MHLRGALLTSIAVAALILLCSALAVAQSYEQHELTIVVEGVEPPCEVHVYSENAVEVFSSSATSSGDLELHVKLSSGIYHISVVSHGGAEPAAGFEAVHLTSDRTITLSTKPLSSYGLREVQIQVLYPNGSPAPHIMITVSPLGLPEVALYAVSDEEGLVHLTCPGVPLLVEASSTPIPVVTRELSVEDLVKEISTRTENESEALEVAHQYFGQSDYVTVVEVALIYRSSKVVVGGNETLTLSENYVNQLDELINALSSEGARGAEGMAVGATPHEPSRGGFNPLLATSSILGISALIALVAFIIARARL